MLLLLNRYQKNYLMIVSVHEFFSLNVSIPHTRRHHEEPLGSVVIQKSVRVRETLPYKDWIASIFNKISQ